jgi:hypothetical protein
MGRVESDRVWLHSFECPWCGKIRMATSPTEPTPDVLEDLEYVAEAHHGDPCPVHWRLRYRRRLERLERGR